MEKVITKDSSATYFNEKYSEHYHSVSGAEEEAIKKFVEPCNMMELAKNKAINILDVCFGLGYNSAAAIDEIRKYSKDCIINIIALENDKEILNLIKNNTTRFNSYGLIKKAAENLSVQDSNISIKIILQDARESIKNIEQGFDLIFLDPFSPKKCPELWTEEFFKNIKNLCNKDAILTTYSCARSVRDNLISVGFKVKDGPCVGRKSPSTIAMNVTAGHSALP